MHNKMCKKSNFCNLNFISVKLLTVLKFTFLLINFNLSFCYEVFDIKNYGAKSDGVTKNTDAIRNAIVNATKNGGGVIYFASGHYLTGPIHLTSNITLQFENGSIVEFSSDFDDYLPMVRSRWAGIEVINFSPLIYCSDNCENIVIRGNNSTLVGNGKKWWDFVYELGAKSKETGIWPTDSKWQQEFLSRNANFNFTELPDEPNWFNVSFLRPPFIQLMDCSNVVIEGITLRDSPFWTINPVYCNNVTVRNVNIKNPNPSPNTDGIDVDSSQNVLIINNTISVNDDCVVIKSGKDMQGRRIARPSVNVTVTDCTMLRGFSGVAIGSDMSGGVRDVYVSNCLFNGTDRGLFFKSNRGRGGVVDNVHVNDITLTNIKREAILINTYRGYPKQPFSERTPVFRNIFIKNYKGNCNKGAVIVGLPESQLENINLINVELTVKELGMAINDTQISLFTNVTILSVE